MDKNVCSGCGVCAGICPGNAIEMRLTQNGEYRPIVNDKCLSCGLCSKVCPFSLDNRKNREADDKSREEKPNLGLGKTTSAFCGYDAEFRNNSASGGLAGGFLKSLLKNGTVDAIVTGGRGIEPPFHFKIITTVEELKNCTGSIYYPLEISEVVSHMLKQEGKYAVVGLPCVIKALRNAAESLPTLKKRITVYLGLVCGHQVSADFTEFIRNACRIPSKDVDQISYHIRDGISPASNYAVQILKKDGESTNVYSQSRLYTLGWEYFKLDACNYCDDIFADKADVVFMDAWLPEFRNETSGRSIAVVRNPAWITYFQTNPNAEETPTENAVESQTHSRVVADKTERVVIRALIAGKLNRLPLKNRKPDWFRLVCEFLPIRLQFFIQKICRRRFPEVKQGKLDFNRFYARLNILHRLRRILALPYAVFYQVKIQYFNRGQ